MNGKKIANALLNIPVIHREWITQNVSPITLARWSKQSVIALHPYRNLKEKLVAVASETEELSSLAKFEKEYEYYE